MSGDFQIELTWTRPRVVCDGQEIPASAIYVQQVSGEPPSMTVVLDARTAAIAGNGDITVQSPKAAVLEFLGKIEPHKLEQETMSRTPWGATVGETVKAVLLEWANAD